MMIELPVFKARSQPKLSQALLARSFARDPSKGPLSLEVASRVLFAAYGCTARKWGLPLRTAPSAGATYPLSIRAVVRDVEGLEPGVYVYSSVSPLEHGLSPSGGSTEGDAPLTILVDCEPERTTRVYGGRGYMYINEEVGHVVQCVAVESGVLGLTFRARIRPATRGTVAEIDVYPAESVELPEPLTEKELGAEEALLRRRSVRKYSPRSLSIEEVEYILSCAVGPSRASKTYPPTPRYTAKLYLAVRNVEDLKPGVYSFEPGEGLELLKTGDPSSALSAAALRQSWVREAPANVVIASSRDAWESEVEAGMAGQNVCLAATAIGLGTVTIGAFYDDEVASVLGIEERPLYILPIGAPV